MLISSVDKLTDLQKAFLCPTNATHRQYEALRAYFVDQLSSKEVAAKFDYTPGSFRVLCHQFRQSPNQPFFLPEGVAARRAEAPRAAKKRSRVRERVIELRKQNLSIYDIVRALAELGEPRSAPAVWSMLHEEGFAK